MISDLTIQATNVTGGYDTHPVIYGTLWITDVTNGQVVVEASWSWTSDWFGNYNFKLTNKTEDKNSASIFFYNSVPSSHNMSSGTPLSITVQSGTLRDASVITLPVAKVPAILQPTGATYFEDQPMTITVSLEHFMVQLTLVSLWQVTCK
jgi:hypothetical protein